MKAGLAFYVAVNFSDGLRSAPIKKDDVDIFWRSMRQPHKAMFCV